MPRVLLWHLCWTCLVQLNAAVVYDLRPFETSLLTKWFKLFTIDWMNGTFSLLPNSSTSDLYGSLDALHVLSTCGQLDNLSKAVQGAWKRTIDSYQVESTGEYATSDADPGRQPYHSAALAAASLALIGQRPAFANRDFEAILANPEMWSATFDPLLLTACYSRKLNANNIHECGQQIGAYPATLVSYDNGTESFSNFVDWWVRWLMNNTDPEFGVLCPIANSTLARDECIGGAMPTYGVMLSLDQGYVLPYPNQSLAFALEVQRETGGVWSDDLDSSKLGSLTLDGIFQVTRSALQLGTPASLQDAQASCVTLLEIAVPQLSNSTRFFDTYATSSHILPNVVAAVAECAQTFPYLVRTIRPWSCCARFV